MADDRTPEGRDGVILRRRAERARLLREARAAQEPQAWEDDEEPSLTRYVEEPDGRVSVEGEAGDVARVIAAARRAKHPVLARVQESLAPVSRKMGTPAGKRAALVAGIVSSVGLIIEVLRQLGAFKGGP